MDCINYGAIVARIKWMIKNDGRKQKDLADYLGKTRQIFYDWQNGAAPSLSDLFKISKYFGVPLEYVISGEESSIDDATAAFIVSTNGLTENQKKSIFASMKAQIDYWKNVNSNEKS